MANVVSIPAKHQHASTVNMSMLTLKEPLCQSRLQHHRAAGVAVDSYWSHGCRQHHHHWLDLNSYEN